MTEGLLVMPRVTLGDLVVAYRKAKVDLHYSSDPRLLNLANYEENLRPNLEALLDLINGRDETWTSEPEFVGSFSLMPKRIRRPSHASGGLHWSDPAKAWAEALGPNGEGRPEAEFRLMARCSIDLHVLSTAWMLTAGGNLEQKISDDSKGSRLRRTKIGRVNRLAPGSFKYYLTPYRRWRDDGLLAMSEALDDGQAVIVLTADATSYYHRLDPTFLLDDQYLVGVLGVNLDPADRKLNRLFVKSLVAWSDLVAEQTGWRARGLPVGLPASAVVANLALVDLDRMASREFKPLYYGRYVDDIILVLRDGDSLQSVADVWDWLVARSGGSLTKVDEPELSITFSPQYLSESDIEFGSQLKNKVFHLSGPSGKFLLGSIKRTIDEQTSRWRALPSVPSDSAQVGTDIAVATTTSGEPTTTLRDADQVSARRAAFAIRLRDFEAFERDLDSASWSEHRAAFFRSVCEQVLVLPKYFEFAAYIPRLIKLAAACGDSESLCLLLRAMAEVYRATVGLGGHDPCGLTVKEFAPAGRSDHLIADRWLDQLLREAYENLLAGSGQYFAPAEVRRIISAIANIDTGWFASLNSLKLRRENARLFVRDLAHVPYRFRWLSPDFAPGRGLPSPALRDRREVPLELPTQKPVAEGLDLLVNRLKQMGKHRASSGGPDPAGCDIPGLRFSTRPLSLLELYLLLHGADNAFYGLPSPSLIRKLLLAVRGHSVAGQLPRVRRGSKRVIDINAGFSRGPRQIALSMFYTSIDSWVSAASGRHDLSHRRYDNLMRPLTELINSPISADYLLLPESSIPSTWFVRIAHKLQLQNINLIAGIEYQTGKRRRSVYNQVWSALRVDGLGFPALTVLRQDKQRPAPHEEAHLLQVARRRLVPEVKWKQPPIVIHGGFAFAILICSELTNINYRSGLRGKIDTLFVAEWNQDLNSFEALVESSALDIHAYIAQANHRSYGDSRIRAPHSDEWARDVVRLRGGIHDYVVVGEIDYRCLRAFQSAYRAPDGPFKPLPDGFRLATWRRRLPMLGKP